MHGSIFLGRNIDPDYMCKEFSRAIYACRLTVPNQRVNMDIFCQLAQIPWRIGKNDILNEDKGVRQCNPFQQNSRRNFQHGRIASESTKIASLHQQFNFIMTSSETMIFAVTNATLAIAWRNRITTGFEPVTSRCRCHALTNWAMKPLTVRAGHLWHQKFPWCMNQWKLWSSQLYYERNFLQWLRGLKIQDFIASNHCVHLQWLDILMLFPKKAMKVGVSCNA